MLLLLLCGATFSVVDMPAALVCNLEHASLQALAATAQAFYTRSAIAMKGQGLEIVFQALLLGLLWWRMLPLP
jgi:hypothetical protein